MITQWLLIIGGVFTIFGMADGGWPFSIVALTFFAAVFVNAYVLHIESIEIHSLWPLKLTVTWWE